VVLVLEQVVVSHTDFTKVTRMVLSVELAICPVNKLSSAFSISSHARTASLLRSFHALCTTCRLRYSTHYPFISIRYNYQRLISTSMFPIAKLPFLPSQLLSSIPTLHTTHLIEVCSVVVLTTSKTSTSGMLPVLPYTTVTGRNVTPVFSSVGESSRHLLHSPLSVLILSKTGEVASL
jgi:hypothetical protein